MNKYLNLLKLNYSLREIYRNFSKLRYHSFSSINFLNDISREKKVFYLNWCQRLENLRRNGNFKDTTELILFFEISAKLELEHTREEAKKVLEEFLEKNDDLSIFSDKDISIMIEYLVNLQIPREIFNLFKYNFIKRKIDSTDYYFIVFRTIFSKEVSHYDIEDLSENVIEFYEINMKNLSISQFIDLLEIYFYLYKPNFSRLLKPIIEYIQNALYIKDSKLENKSVLQICSAYPRLLNLYGDDDLLRKEMIKVQNKVEKMKFELTESLVIIQNNISIYGKGSLNTNILNQNLPTIYKYLTGIDNSNYFTLFFLLTLYKLENSILVEKILKDLIILIQYINPEVLDEKRETFFQQYKRICVQKINDIREIIEKRKSDKDVKYSMTFISILTKAAELNPVSFADYPISSLIYSYENLVNILE